MRHQGRLLGLSRSSFYYRPQAEKAYNRPVMHLMDEHYVRPPFYGVARMTAWLRRQGHAVNAKRVHRLLRQTGLEATYPRKKQGLSQADRSHQVYPYLLRDLAVTPANQVWASDLIYIRMTRDWVYLMAVLDWFSRCVLTWEISITLEADSCVTALQRALAWRHPEIFSTDQGRQSTSGGWLETLERAAVTISMDGRGRGRSWPGAELRLLQQAAAAPGVGLSQKLSRLSLEFDLRPGNRGRLYAAASCLSRSVAIALISCGS